jgi:hypothetical protein
VYYKKKRKRRKKIKEFEGWRLYEENDADKKEEGELCRKVKESMKKEGKVGDPCRRRWLKALKIKLDGTTHLREDMTMK